MLNDALHILASFLPQQLPQLNPLMAFGVLLAFGTLGGILAARLKWLPTITGFMALGLLIGPSGLGLLSREALIGSQPLVEIALGLILFKLGSTLHPWAVLRNRALVITSLLESVLTFGAIFGLMTWIGAAPMVAVIAAAIAVSSSPAVLIHVSEELHAQGPSVEAAEALVAMNNLLAFVLFSFSLPLALRNAQQFDPMTAILLPAYQLVGAVVIAVAVAWIITRIALQTRVDEQHFRFALVVGAVMLGLGLASALNVSSLFVSLTLGVACRWMQGRARLTRVEFGGGGDVFFIILFVFAGANLHIRDLLESAGIALAFVLVRMIVKCTSIYGSGRLFGYTRRQSLAVGLLLVPMAGLAIGLVQTTTELLPQLASQVSAVVLGAVAVFETIGPPLAAFALRFTDEAGKAPSAPDDEPEAAAGTPPQPAASAIADDAAPPRAALESPRRVA